MVLANRIKRIRKAQNLTQSNVAHRCEMSTSAYGQIERKATKCTYETLTKIAQALDVSVPFLVDVNNKNFKEVKNQ